jgi:hypothetical protein
MESPANIYRKEVALPLRDLVGVQIKLLCQLGQRLVALQRSDCDFRLECCRVIPSGPSHLLLLYRAICSPMRAGCPLISQSYFAQPPLHLSAKVQLMWGSSDLDLFIRSLFMDSRDGERRGLRLEIVTELLFLAKTNKTLRAIDAAATLGLSLHEAHRLIDEARLVASQNRAAQQQEPITLASRHKAAEESSSTSILGNFIIYLMIATICGILIWILTR